MKEKFKKIFLGLIFVLAICVLIFPNNNVAASDGYRTRLIVRIS